MRFPRLSKTLLAAALGASTLAAASPALADDYDGYRRHRDNDGAVAVAAGLAGLAVGAIIASGGHRHRDCDDDWRCRARYEVRYQGGYYDGPARVYYPAPARVYYPVPERVYYRPGYVVVERPAYGGWRGW